MTSKYTKSAKNQECTVRIPGICNHNPETVVFAHLNGAGMGMKHAGIHGAYACSNCHDFYDARVNRLKWFAEYGTRESDLNVMFYDALIRTQQIMIKNGVLKL